MHRLPNQYSVTRFRLAALLLLVKWLLVMAAAAVLCNSLCVGNCDLTLLAVGLLGLAVATTLVQWLVAGRVRCPLCIGHPLSHRACATHRETRRLFGSYRLRVAMAVIFKGRFRCPYCAEFTVIAVRRRRQG